MVLLQDKAPFVLPLTLHASSTQHPQEHQLEHWKMAVGGHKKECKRLKAEKEQADPAAAAELARLSLGGAGGSSGASASGSGSRRGGGSARAPRGVSSAAAAAGGSAHGRVGGAFDEVAEVVD